MFRGRALTPLVVRPCYIPAMVARTIVSACWVIFILTWVIAALFTKRTVYRESAAQRFRYVVPILLGWLLVFNDYRLQSSLHRRIIPENSIVSAAAAIICLAGLGFCLWARATLGRNWSGTVTLKEDHELIVRGPYRLVRHPIYTGLQGMMLATALLHGRVAALIGLGLVFVSLLIKAVGEEQLMLRQFPGQYPAYQQRVKRIIPFVF